MTFDQLDIIKPILKALTHEGYTNPTPIQENAIKPILDGRDLLACAQTGTGKTAAFVIPILQNLVTIGRKNKTQRNIEVLILAPTRELAIQIGQSIDAYGKFLNIKNTVIFGGVSQKAQVDSLNKGVDILVATPGRLLDLMDQGYVDLDSVKFFVLDEADRMLHMGFINDVKKVSYKLPKERQTLLFSATMPEEIEKLANTLLKNPDKIAVTPVSSTVDIIEQKLYFVERKDKKHLLQDILENDNVNSAIIFSRTKHGANKIVKDLLKVGIESEAIHGDKSQNSRQLALNNFKEGKIKVLVATDIASRGIDIDYLSHVINYDLPEESETYVHRIGRTGRAGQEGIAISFCDEESHNHLKGIEKLTGKSINVVENHKFPMSEEVKKLMETFVRKKVPPMGKPQNKKSSNKFHKKKP